MSETAAGRLGAFSEIFKEFTAAFDDVLDPKITGLIGVAMEASAATRDENALRARVTSAVHVGASQAELYEVLKLVSLINTHSLIAVLEPSTEIVTATEPTYHRIFESYFPGFHHQFQEFSPAMFSAYEELGAHLWESELLEAKWRELVFVAMDLTPAHLFDRGARLHIEMARRYGATEMEIAAVVSEAMKLGRWSIDRGATIVSEVIDELAGSGS